VSRVDAAGTIGGSTVYVADLVLPGGGVTASDTPDRRSRLVEEHGMWTRPAASAAVVDRAFETPAVHQGHLEPEACAARVTGDGRAEVWAARKSPCRCPAPRSRAGA